MYPSDAERNWMRNHGRSPTVDEFNMLKEMREPVKPRTTTITLTLTSQQADTVARGLGSRREELEMGQDHEMYGYNELEVITEIENLIIAEKMK